MFAFKMSNQNAEERYVFIFLVQASWLTTFLLVNDFLFHKCLSLIMHKEPFSLSGLLLKWHFQLLLYWIQHFWVLQMVLLKVSLSFGQANFYLFKHWWEVNNKNALWNKREQKCNIKYNCSPWFQAYQTCSHKWIMKKQMLSITRVTLSYLTMSNTPPGFSHPSRRPPTLSFQGRMI